MRGRRRASAPSPVSARSASETRGAGPGACHRCRSSPPTRRNATRRLGVAAGYAPLSGLDRAVQGRAVGGILAAL